MFGYSEYSEQGRPWFHAGKLPVTTTVLLVAVFSISMILVSVAGGIGRAPSWALVTPKVWDGAFWLVATWPLFNGPSIFFVLSMVMLFFFGREVERILGRTGMLKFIGWLALALIAVTLAIPRGMLAGADLLGFGVFLAFAIMFPGARMIFGLTAKWVALILLGINTCGHLYDQNWTGLAQLAVTCVATAIILKAMGAAYGLSHLQLPTLRLARPTTGSTRSQRHDSAPRLKGAGPREFVSPEPEIDRLLDKVGSHGFDSLSPEEQRILKDASSRYRRRL